MPNQKIQVAYKFSKREIKNLPLSLQDLAKRVKIVYADVKVAHALVSERNPVLKIPSHRLRVIEDKDWRKYRNRMTTYHELGHSMAGSKRLSMEEMREWNKIVRSEPQDIVALRGKDASEDFAQSFMLYHLHGRELRESQLMRYNFMRRLHKDKKEDGEIISKLKIKKLPKSVTYV